MEWEKGNLKKKKVDRECRLRKLWEKIQWESAKRKQNKRDERVQYKKGKKKNVETKWRELTKQMEGLKWEKGVRKEREGRIGKCRENNEKKYSISIKQNRNFIILFLDFDTFLSNWSQFLNFQTSFIICLKNWGGKKQSNWLQRCQRALSSKI